MTSTTTSTATSTRTSKGTGTGADAVHHVNPAVGTVAAAGRPTNLALDDQLCFALYSATNLVTRAYRPLLDKIGLTYPQYLVMLVLWEHDGCPVRHIGARLDLSANAVTPLIDRLAAAGLLTRRTDPLDRRVTRVHLTDAGRELEHAAADVQHAVVCATGLSNTELRLLRDALRHLHDTAETGTRG